MSRHLVASTELITDAETFRQLGPEWDALLVQSRQHSYFLRWHWAWLWWTHLAPAGARLRLVCCRNAAGDLVGIAPLYLKRRSILSVIPIGELYLLGTGIPIRTSESVDVFAARDAEPAVGEAIAAALAAAPGWDRLCLQRVPADADFGGHIVRTLGADGSGPSCEQAPFIDVSEGWQRYRQSLGRSMRRNVDYYPRRLFQQHSCVFEQVTSARALPGAIDALMNLHQARWQSAGQPGAFANPAVASFLHAVSTAALAQGHLRLWVLWMDGRIEAAIVGFADAGVVHYFQAGFNPAYAGEDLGTVIVALAVKACCDDPSVQTFDFMGGGGYKTMWARQHRDMVCHESWRLNPRTVLARASSAWWAAATRAYRAAAPPAWREARRRWLTERRRGTARLTAGTAPQPADAGAAVRAPR